MNIKANEIRRGDVVETSRGLTICRAVKTDTRQNTRVIVATLSEGRTDPGSEFEFFEDEDVEVYRGEPS